MCPPGSLVRLRELDGVRPKVPEDAWLVPDAVVIGDVVLGSQATVWFGCLVRWTRTASGSGRGRTSRT